MTLGKYLSDELFAAGEGMAGPGSNGDSSVVTGATGRQARIERNYIIRRDASGAVRWAATRPVARGRVGIMRARRQTRGRGHRLQGGGVRGPTRGWPEIERPSLRSRTCARRALVAGGRVRGSGHAEQANETIDECRAPGPAS
jgi:hypothetical protein